MLFTKHFERLSTKHQIHGIADLFSPQQNKAIGEVRAALSQLDDYELSDAELTQTVSDALLGNTKHMLDWLNPSSIYTMKKG
ncbi:hypothetical protein [Paraglaciecola sp. 2405UD69-4]|uniref:hypothetical protein n=1 Tax=Paraglaciecola sp. 2405UD69-4 TaxID=3391836 RepID=UPI0039C9E61C